MLAFIHIQKNAGTTIKDILSRSFGVRYCDVDIWSNFLKKDWFNSYLSINDLNKIQKYYFKYECIAGHLIKPYSDLDKTQDIKYITFLREPISRTISYYQFWVDEYGYRSSFNNYLKNTRLHNLQTKHISNSDNVDDAIKMLDKLFFVGIVEYIDESLLILNKRLKYYLDIRYESKNVSKSSNIKDKILSCKKILLKINEINASDIQLYNYVKNTLYLKEKKLYGDNLNADLSYFKEHKILDKNSALKSKINRIGTLGLRAILNPKRALNLEPKIYSKEIQY